METESTKVYVVYGAEELPYRRMIYGSDSQTGITPGTFYDLRTTVVPYYPKVPTAFRVVFDQEYLSYTHQVTVRYEDPKAPQQTFQLFPQNSHDFEGSFSIQLGLGLNIFEIRANNRLVYTFSVTATNYGKFIRAYAEAIQTNIWDPLDTLVASLYSSTATRLLDVYFGDVLNLLPHEENLTRFSQQLLASSMVEHAGTETGALLMATALFQHTVKIDDTQTKYDLKNLWLYPVTSRGARSDRDVRIWALTKRQGRYGTFAQLQSNLGHAVDQNEYVTLINGEHYYLQDISVEDVVSDERSWAELQIETDQVLEVEFGVRNHARVQFPGLWDSGDPPWLDQNLLYDTGTWDSGDTSGDPDKSYFIGTSVVPGQLGEMLGVGTSTIDRSVSEYACNLSITADLQII